MTDLFTEPDRDERLLAREHPDFRKILEAEADRIAEYAFASTPADLRRLALLAERQADQAREDGDIDAEANGRALAAVFRRRARALGLN